MEMSISWHDDTVICFEPQKVMWRVKEWFPEATLDYTDYGDVKRNREKAVFTDQVMEEDQRARLFDQCDDAYRVNSPSYRFQIPCDDGGGDVQGISRRLVVSVRRDTVPPSQVLKRLEDFLKSFEIGTFESRGETNA